MSKGLSITFLLIGVNLLIFVCMAVNGVSLFEPTPESILNWGGNDSSLTLDGDWWRLITSLFVHIGIFHLVMNLYSLFYIGTCLEPILGKTRFLLTYLSTGIFAGMASLFSNKYSYTVAAGASGAIFGMFGVFVAVLSTNLISEKIRNTFLKNTLIFIGYNLIHGIRPGIDNSAHIGGLVSGLVFGYCIYPSLSFYSQSRRIKMFTSCFLLLLTVFSTDWFLRSERSSPSFRFDRIVDKITNDQKDIDSLIDNINQNSPLETLIYMNHYIYPRYEEIKLLADQANALQLKGEKAKRRDFVVKYIDLSYEKYELFIKSIRGNTSMFDARIDEINEEIAQLSPN